MDRKLQVLGFAGSLRQGSYNRSLLRAAQELAPDGMTLRTFDLAPLPLSTTSQNRAPRRPSPRSGPRSGKRTRC
jgi:NAD(P)H-dependent FMN reductase